MLRRQLTLWPGRRVSLNSMMMHTNRLAGEKSPYLLQHQHNPVEWYPWGEPAFQAARKSNKPIFLSVGYSTCHWCHVMERESFESEEIAKTMNKYFVNVKVDREERPDVDAQYMMFVQVTTGGGGWPMSVFLTPELKPFFGGTYFPPKDTFSMPGFPHILKLIAERWENDSNGIRASSTRIAHQINQIIEPGVSSGNEKSDELAVQKAEWIHTALEYFKSKFDEEYGGFGGAPKFPTPVNLLFLQRIAELCKDLIKKSHSNSASTVNTEQATVLATALGVRDIKDAGQIHQVLQQVLKMVEKTLEAIWRGGIHDHIGLGVHRYAVDRKWLVPHFEKMLYDQSQLLHVYAEASRQSPTNPLYQNAMEDIITYMVNNLHYHKGGFFCAEDADSLPDEAKEGLNNKQEGAFAVWTREQIEKILPPREAELFCSHYGVESKGNVPISMDHHGELSGKNVLMEQRKVEETAQLFKLSVSECQRILQESRAALASVRATRPRPHLDDKILTAWNALAISGLCHSFRATNKPNTLHLAQDTAAFIKQNLTVEGGKLVRTYRNGPTNIPAFAIDYALLTAAALDLWDVTLEKHYLDWAIDLQSQSTDLFWDQSHGGFYNTPIGATDIQFRIKEVQDGAEPAVNSVALNNLLQLYLITGETSYWAQYEKVIRCFKSQICDAPYGRPALLSALLFELSIPYKFTLLCPGDILNSPLIDPKASELKSAIDKESPAFKVYAVKQNSSIALQSCRGTTCQAPIDTPDKVSGIV